MHKKSPFYYPIVLSIVLASGMLLGYILSFNSTSKNVFSSSYSETDKINEVLKLIQKDYVDTINERELVENTLTEMLHNLDPHSSYIPAKTFQNIEKSTVFHHKPLHGSSDSSTGYKTNRSK